MTVANSISTTVRCRTTRLILASPVARSITHLLGLGLSGLQQVREGRAEFPGGVQEPIAGRLVIHQGGYHSDALRHLRQVRGDRRDRGAHRGMVYVIRRSRGQCHHLGGRGVHGRDLRAHVLLVSVDGLLDPSQRRRIGAELGYLGFRRELGLRDVDHLVTGGDGRQ